MGICGQLDVCTARDPNHSSSQVFDRNIALRLWRKAKRMDRAFDDLYGRCSPSIIPSPTEECRSCMETLLPHNLPYENVTAKEMRDSLLTDYTVLGKVVGALTRMHEVWLACLCVASYLLPSMGELSPAFSDLNIGTKNICGENVPPQYPADIDFPFHEVVIPPSFRRNIHRLERKALQLKHSVTSLLRLYEEDRLSRSADIDEITYFPPCFQLINRTSFVVMSELSPFTIYRSLKRDFHTMTDFLGMLELMKEDEATFENSELILNFLQIEINTKSLLCELSFSISALESSVPSTVVRLRLDKWCVAEGADDCWRCNRDSMILSMIDKLCFTLRDKYRHIRRNIF
ncbi:uncharacterized protein LOC132561093 [Ylistrum balloti]|uniref:uncharacterized protein LOC132561093 n=1 Tax=Ylistrum balloti TaxID=509963 RepID=UPI00290598C4|nr:uncharacterized protein LOC132561093 [Ylistrum balloti]